ncbi:MAG: transposase family protein, partial [Propionibacteriaceae bacterium]|nr:transposase family protein [Propionibacteriaceae bacterium]
PNLENPTHPSCPQNMKHSRMQAPIRPSQDEKLTKAEEEFNRQINQHRWAVGQAIAHLKTWRILSAIYRRPYPTFKTTIKAVLGLIFMLH